MFTLNLRNPKLLLGLFFFTPSYHFYIFYSHRAFLSPSRFSIALYALINPTYSCAAASLQPFLHTPVSFWHFHPSLFFLFRLVPHFSTFDFTPQRHPQPLFFSPLFPSVCVVAECVWLFFRQQPRRLDCHNLWFWVISVSNPNLGTGTFFLPSSSYSSSSPTPSPSRSFSPSCAAFHIIFHSLPVTQQHNPFWTVSIIQSLAPDHHLWGRSILLSFKFTLAFIWMNGTLASWPFMAFSAAGSSVALMSFSNQIVFFICMYACICTVLCFSTSQGTG